MTTSIETATHDFSQGAMSPELAMSLLEGMEGDTGSTPDNGGAPTTTPEAGANAGATIDQTQKTQAANPAGEGGATDPEAGIDPSKAVVLAKDGVHTIPYDKLVEARNGEQHWKAQAEAAQQQLATLQADAQAREAAGQAPTNIDNMAAQAQAAIDAGADPSLFGDFSEEGLSAGIFKMRDQLREQLRTEIRTEMRAEIAELQKVLAPIQEQREKAAQSAHDAAIYGAYPNADSIVQSQEFGTWINSMPKAVGDAYWGLFDRNTGGTAQEIVAMLDQYAKATGMAPAASKTAAPDKSAAQAAAASVQSAPPSSLSAIPGGRVDARSPDEQLAGLSNQDKFLALLDKTPEQVEAYLSKRM